MPIDPSIPLGIRPVEIQSPMQTLGRFHQMSAQRDEAALRRLQREQVNQKLQENEALKGVITEAWDPEKGVLNYDLVASKGATVAPQATADYLAKVSETDVKKQTAQMAHRTADDQHAKALREAEQARLDAVERIGGEIFDTVSAVERLPIEKRQGAWEAALNNIVTMASKTNPETGKIVAERLMPGGQMVPYSPEVSQRMLLGLKASAKAVEAEKERRETLKTWVEVARQGVAGSTDDSGLANTRKLLMSQGAPAEVVNMVPTKIADAPKFLQAASGTRVTPEQRAQDAYERGDMAQYRRQLGLIRDIAAQRREPQASSEEGNSVREAVTAMKEGRVPPQLPGRASKDYVAILAEASRQKFDLVGAVNDWVSTQKFLVAANSTQQLRLRQAINQLPALLDSVADLAKKWKGGKFPALNRARLALAKGGVYGREAASIASRLDTLIADVTADLGSVYMGGNSPTDHALQLAETALKSEWDEKVLLDMVEMARDNVKIRNNSIRTTGPSATGESNQYYTPMDPEPVQHAPVGAAPPPVPGQTILTPFQEYKLKRDSGARR